MATQLKLEAQADDVGEVKNFIMTKLATKFWHDWIWIFAKLPPSRKLVSLGCQEFANFCSQEIFRLLNFCIFLKKWEEKKLGHRFQRSLRREYFQNNAFPYVAEFDFSRCPNCYEFWAKPHLCGLMIWWSVVLSLLSAEVRATSLLRTPFLVTKVDHFALMTEVPKPYKGDF